MHPFIPVLSPSFLYHPYIPSFKSKDFSFTCIQKNGTLMMIYVVLEIVKLNELLDSYNDFSECQLNANGL